MAANGPVRGEATTPTGAALLRVGVHVRGSMRWMRDRKSLSGYLGAEYLLTMGIAQAGILMVGFVSQAGVGAIRAAQVLMGPTNVIVQPITVAKNGRAANASCSPRGANKHGCDVKGRYVYRL